MIYLDEKMTGFIWLNSQQIQVQVGQFSTLVDTIKERHGGIYLANSRQPIYHSKSWKLLVYNFPRQRQLGRTLGKVMKEPKYSWVSRGAFIMMKIKELSYQLI